VQREGEKSTPSVVDFLLSSLRMVSGQLLALGSLVMNAQDKRRKGEEEKWIKEEDSVARILPLSFSPFYPLLLIPFPLTTDS